jgi:hypothetical protein
MEFKEYDFTRNPVVQNEVFFLQSKCTACGFSILVRSVEELVEHEELHRTQCSLQMSLPNLPSMRGAALNSRILKILTLLMVIIPRPARSHANFVHVPDLADTRIRDVFDELHPDDTGDCFSLGELDIVFRPGNDGPPNVGVVLMGPRGRRIGLILLSNTPGRNYLSRKVISVAMIWAVRIPAGELSRYAGRSAGPIGSK